MIANLKLDAARSRLISGFVDSYLKLSETETIELKTAIQSIAPPERKVVMEIMTSWEKDGMKKGLQKGLQQGASSIVSKHVSKKFGTVDKAILKKVKALPYELSNQLADVLLDFRTIQELEDWLSAH